MPSRTTSFTCDTVSTRNSSEVPGLANKVTPPLTGVHMVGSSLLIPTIHPAASGSGRSREFEFKPVMCSNPACSRLSVQKTRLQPSLPAMSDNIDSFISFNASSTDISILLWIS